MDYLVADTWDRALDLLDETGPESRILAGGQSLIRALNLREIRPSAVIDINPIPTPEPAVTDGVLVLPALTRQQILLTSPLVRRHAPLLAAGVRHLGNVRVRTLGTLGGSLWHADPAAELPCVVQALGAQLLLRGRDGIRTVGAVDFFREPPVDGLLTEIHIPVRRPGEGWAFHEAARRQCGTATVAVAAVVRGEAATVALAGVAPRPVTVPPELIGSPADTAAAVARWVMPGSDVRASAAHRTRLAEVLTRRALVDARDRTEDSAA
jgi:2-furoyl-CoA dehydrogenase FAD binding subunit